MITSRHWLPLATRVCKRGLMVIALVALILPLAGLAAEEDPRLQAKLEELVDKPPAPDFTLTDFNGNTFTLSEHRGKWLFVHFWSVYCPHCAREVSTLEQLYELYQNLKKTGEVTEDVEFLAINFGEGKEEIMTWAKAHNVSLESTAAGDVHLLLDKDKAVAKSWKVYGLPSTFLINDKGQIVAQAIGERDWTTPAILEQIGLLHE